MERVIKDVVGWEGSYRVSNLGEVFNAKGRKIKGCERTGYLRAHLRRKGESKFELIHKLVLNAFVGPRPEGLQCRHLDGDRKNNRLDNLVWGTPIENAVDKRVHGTILEGEDHPRGRLTYDDVLDMRQRRFDGEAVEYLAQEYGVHPAYARSIINGRRWKSAPGAVKRKTNGQVLEA